MAQATLTARVDEKDKINFDAFCSNVGLNTSTAINLFVKAVLRENRIPFEIAQSSDPLQGAFSRRINDKDRLVNDTYSSCIFP